MSQISSNPDRLPLPKPEKTGKKPPKRIKTKTDYEWIKTRNAFLKGKQNHQGYYTCEYCGARVESVDPHHVQTKGSRKDLKYDQSNLVAICHDCHMREHGQIN